MLDEVTIKRWIRAPLKGLFPSILTVPVKILGNNLHESKFYSGKS
jgi:hypothetical protein